MEKDAIILAQMIWELSEKTEGTIPKKHTILLETAGNILESLYTTNTTACQCVSRAYLDARETIK